MARIKSTCSYWGKGISMSICGTIIYMVWNACSPGTHKVCLGFIIGEHLALGLFSSYTCDMSRWEYIQKNQCFRIFCGNIHVSVLIRVLASCRSLYIFGCEHLWRCMYMPESHFATGWFRYLSRRIYVHGENWFTQKWIWFDLVCCRVLWRKKSNL